MRLVSGPLSARWLSLACRLVLSAVFVAAALGKIGDPQRFADAVAGFHLLPISWVNVFAITLPWMEMLAGLALLVDSQARQAGLLVAVLNVVFLFAVASAMLRGLDVECGCFTVSKAHSHVGWALIGRDILLLAICYPVVIAKDRPSIASRA